MRSESTTRLTLTPWEGKKRKLLERWYVNYAINILATLTGKFKNQELAVEAVQELYIILGEKSLSELLLWEIFKKNLSGFLYTIALNCAFKILKDNKSQPESFDIYEPCVLRELTAESVEVKEESTWSAKRVIFMRFLQKENHKIQEIFELLFSGYSCMQIAEITKRPIDSIYRCRSRTIKNFRQSLINDTNKK